MANVGLGVAIDDRRVGIRLGHMRDIIDWRRDDLAGRDNRRLQRDIGQRIHRAEAAGGGRHRLQGGNGSDQLSGRFVVAPPGEVADVENLLTDDFPDPVVFETTNLHEVMVSGVLRLLVANPATAL